MHRAFYTKPDLRRLWVYSRHPMNAIPKQCILAPGSDAVSRTTHLRWHPLREEWVIYAAHRQDRPLMPDPYSNPLAPSADPARPTELPVGDYEVAVFENRFPSLVARPEEPERIAGVTGKPAFGQSEVVVFSQNPELSLSQLSVSHIALVLEVLADRTRDMASEGISHVLPFENRGVEMGVTLQHPHAQIYGYGFVPAEVSRVTAVLRSYEEKYGRDMVADLVKSECELGIRVVAKADHAAAFVPPFARFPYETWVVPLRSGADLINLTACELHDLAAVLRQVLKRLDGLWDLRAPYLMSVNQAPTGQTNWTLRIEIWPTRRSRNKLKFLAGTELAAGVFASDILPETAAAQLREVSL